MSTKNIVPRANEEGGVGTSIKKWLSGFFKYLTVTQITLGGVSRTTWPDPGSGSQSLTDVLANGPEGNIPAGQKAALKNSDGTKTYFEVDEVTGDVTFQGYSRKNAIINGNFDIWQRGAIFNDITNNYTVDRWDISKDGSGATVNVTRQAFTVGQTDVPNEPRYFFRHDVTVAGTGETFHRQLQRIESVRTYAGQTVTLSFYAKTGSAITLPTIQLLQIFGTGGTPAATVYTSLSTDISIGTTWTKYTYSATVPSISGKTLGTNGDDALGIFFYLPINATFTFDLAQVQLEKGSQATEFDRRSVGEELALCKRYFERMDYDSVAYEAIASGYADSTILGQFFLKYVEKRVAPTVTSTVFGTFYIIIAGADIAVDSAIAYDVMGKKGCRAKATMTAGLTAGDGCMLARNSTDICYIDIDAEL